METTKTYNLQLTKEIYSGLMDQTIKAKDLIKYLLTFDIIENTKEDINNTAIKDLKCNDEVVINATIDCLKMCMVITTKKNEIVIDKAIINDSEIYINCGNTTMERETNVIKHDVKELVSMHKEIVKVAKNKGVKVSYANKTKQYITVNSEVYNKDINDYKDIYSSLCSMWKERLNTPIYQGYGSDETINNIHKKGWELNKYKTRSSVIYRFNEIEKRYKELLNELNNSNCRLIKIVL